MRNRVLRLAVALFAASCLLSGVGCFFTSTPPANECTGDADCNTGFICEDARCVSEGGGPPACDGDLRITWDFDGETGCPEDVEDMVIKLFSPTGAAIHTNPQGDSVSCSAGERVYSNLPCGTYQIQVQAVDSASAFTWSAPQAPVNIVDDQTAAVTANLAPE